LSFGCQDGVRFVEEILEEDTPKEQLDANQIVQYFMEELKQWDERNVA